MGGLTGLTTPNQASFRVRQIPKISADQLSFWVDGPGGSQIPMERLPNSFRGDFTAQGTVKSPQHDFKRSFGDFTYLPDSWHPLTEASQ